uniref:high mobility group B protein 15-like n=1 Tax=Erigeron canadensis TaxID=72917 RepID=UPI001CB9546A|nr:high mobility group B protein 15-like [Erigeron canadensis]
MAASSSTDNNTSLATSKDKAMQSYSYPPPIAHYEDVFSNSKLFMDILGKFHAALGTKFKIPIVGGRDLDLHRLFVEVTSRGGIKKVLEEKKWRDVTNCFDFPASATNASFILRKYYMSLIHHFEEVYYFKAKAWTPVPTETWQGTTTDNASTSRVNKPMPPIPETQIIPSAENQPASVKRQKISEESSLKGSQEAPIGLPVTGIIDGKFESGYLCTVTIGPEKLQGVLYQTVQNSPYEIPNHEGVVNMDATQGPPTVRRRRRRRKKSEIKKRDPARPKPNRSGYNFFFAEQHARLKLLHTNKDRAISRMIGEEWNKLNESQKAIYQEKAMKDKERYRSEMEHYREGFNRGQVLTNATPLQQQYYMADTTMMAVEKTDNNGGSSHQIHENEPNSEFSDDDSSSFENEEKITGKDSNSEMGAEYVHMEMKPKEKILFDEHTKASKNLSGFLDGPDQYKSPIQGNEPLIFENEPAHIQMNELKQDGKTSVCEPLILDINDGSNSKSADDHENNLVKFDAIVQKQASGY